MDSGYNTAKVHASPFTTSSGSSQNSNNKRLLFQNPLETTLDAPPRPGSLNTTNNTINEQSTNKSLAGRLRPNINNNNQKLHQSQLHSPSHNLAIPMGPFTRK